MPNRLTNHIGGQIVTANGVTEERQFIVDLDGSETRTAGNIYFTRSTISNSVSITAFAFTDTSTIGNGGGTRVVRVTGDEGAQYSLSYSSGASGDTSLQTIPASGMQDTTVTIAANGVGSSARNPGVTIAVNASSEPETVLADGVNATISISQSAGRVARSTILFSGNYNLGPSGASTENAGTGPTSSRFTWNNINATTNPGFSVTAGGTSFISILDQGFQSGDRYFADVRYQWSSDDGATTTVTVNGS